MARWIKFLFCLFCSLSLLSAGAADDRNLSHRTGNKRVALIIGNAAYQGLKPLSNPANDAEDMAKALKSFGFEVMYYKDLNRRNMAEAISDFGRRVGGAEAALFYYAGHGIQVRGQNYLMPVNAAADSEAAVMDEGINVNRVLDEMEGGAARINIVMLDACRDNPITGKFRTAGTRGLAPPSAAPKGTVIVYATDPGNTASDGSGRNGLFTAGMLSAFKGKDLSLDGVLTEASSYVEKTSGNRQTPYVNGPKTVQKNFYFRIDGNITVQPGPGEMDREFWNSVKDSSDPADFEAYLKQYPNGAFRALAENRLKRLKVQPATPTITQNDNKPNNNYGAPQPQPQISRPGRLARYLISNGGQVMSTYDFSGHDIVSKDGRWSSSYLSSEANERNWPEDIATFEKRNAFKGGGHIMDGLVGYEAARIDGKHIILYVPKEENRSARFNVSKSFFVALTESGVAAQGGGSTAGPTVNLRRIYISKPGEVMSTYDYAGKQIKYLDTARHSESSIAALGHERNWPDAINTFDKRMKVGSHPMDGLVGYEVAILPDGVVMYVPRAENSGAKFDVSKDFYVAIRNNGVSGR